MTDPPDPFDATRPLDEVERHDRLCDRYEAGIWAGRAEPIEEVLAEVPEAERAELFAALVRVARECLDPPPDEGDYRLRFPQFVDRIGPLFCDPSSGTHSLRPGAVADDPLPVLPGYSVERRVGSGGMGVVYLARQLHLDRPVAVKVMRLGFESRPDARLRFVREAQAASRVDHPHVVKVLDAFLGNGLAYYVMEYVPGGTLADRVTGHPLDPKWAADVVATVAGAVQCVHAHHIVHRDLKPSNVLMTEDGQPKVADFGLAKHRTDSDPGLTRTHAVLGTASYMAPEQAAGDTKGAGPAADVYALGAILYELLTGRPPFREATYELTLRRVLTDEPPRPTALVPGLCEDLEAICLRCLEKEPGDRYPTAADLADDLRRWRAGEPVSARRRTVLDEATRWGRRAGFEICELLGCTRLAFVYVAVKQSFERTVILKLSTGPADSPEHAALKRQATILAGLSHENLIRLFDYGVALDQPYLVLDYIEGGVSLARRMAEAADPNGRPLTPQAIAAITRQIATGVQSAHDRGVLHLGLNPHAVILTPADVPKVGGFGSARIVEDSADAPTVPAPAFEHPNYVAPEVLAGRWECVSAAADVYALGAVLFELLTGTPPTPNRAPAETRESLLTRSAQSHAHRELADICLRCLEQDPNRRFPRMAHVVDRLAAVETGTGGGDDGETTVSAGNARAVAVTPFRLRVVSGPTDTGRTCPVRKRRVLIGRGPDCDLCLPSDAVSREHCGLVWDGQIGCHFVTDYGSKNGIRVNGRSVAGSHPLAAGDRITVVNYVLQFESECPSLPD